MSQKQLTASVRLNTSQAEQKLKNLARTIDILNRNVGKQSNAYNQVNSALNKTVATTEKVKRKTDATTQSTKKWNNALSGVNSKLNNSSNTLGIIGTKIRRLASAYLGIMGGKALVNTSDTITSAENKLNYVNGYDVSMTQEAMDKMYASAQKVRMSYTDMMSNVSKSMVLAGDAFQDNIDNAIRFQEIMAEAYAVGGASAAEMSSSMYQLIQALGSGVLQGDELRSVREGAPLAYKAIEKFAQGVYNTSDSLKELGKDSKITSDMVVAAIMTAGNEMDSAFAQTKQTFAQTWEQIKNVAKKSFEPVARMMREGLNNAIDNGFIKKVETVFTYVSKVLQITFKSISNLFSWVSKNWDWLQHIILVGLMAYGVYLVVLTSVAIKNAMIRFTLWVLEHSHILMIVGAITMLIYAFYLWQQGAIDTCNAICIALLAVGMVAFLIFGWQVALVIALLALVLHFFEQVCGLAWATVRYLIDVCIALLNIVSTIIVLMGTIVINLFFLIVNAFIWLMNTIIGALAWGAATTYNLVVGLVEGFLQTIYSIVDPIVGIIEWFVNAWNGAFTSVGGAFANFCGQLLSGLIGLVKPFAKLLDKVFDWNVNGMIESAQSSMKGWGKTDSAVTYSVNSPELPRLNTTDIFKKGYDTFDYINYLDADSMVEDAFTMWGNPSFNLDSYYKEGADWGAGVKDWINDKGGNLADKVNNSLNKFDLDSIGKKLGLDFSKLNNGFPNVNDPAYDVASGNAYDPSKALKGIKGDTGKLADGMDLTKDDLDYLRKIAETEWKKEFTTAEIKVEMNNNNSINGESDLDGLVTRLTDKLYEELSYVADGVYV